MKFHNMPFLFSSRFQKDSNSLWSYSRNPSASNHHAALWLQDLTVPAVMDCNHCVCVLYVGGGIQVSILSLINLLCSEMFCQSNRIIQRSLAGKECVCTNGVVSFQGSDISCWLYAFYKEKNAVKYFCLSWQKCSVRWCQTVILKHEFFGVELGNAGKW